MKKVKAFLAVLVVALSIFVSTPPKTEAAVNNTICTSFYNLSNSGASLSAVISAYGYTFNGFTTEFAYNYAKNPNYNYLTFKGYVCDR